MLLKRVLKVFLFVFMIAALSVAAYASPGTIKAGEVDCAYICAELDILRGEGDGVTDEYLLKETKRVQAAYLTLRLVGKEPEAEAYTGTDNFNDVGHIYEGGQRRTAYLKAHSSLYGWEGDGSNNLMPDNPLTAQQFYKVLLTVLGYQANVDYPYEDTLSYAANVAGMDELRHISGPLINDDIAVMLVEAMLARVRNETYTLAELLAEQGVIDFDKALDLGMIGRTDIISDHEPTPAPNLSSLVAETISAVNFAEIDILFNQPIDRASADRNYIKVNGSPLLSGDHVIALDDGVTLRLYRETGFVSSQGQRITVSLSKVKSAGGQLEMAAIVDREIAVYDSQPPSLAAVEAMGLRYVKLVFSEPVRFSDSSVMNYATYRFNGRVMPAAEAVVCNGREVFLNFATPLELGQNKLTIVRNGVYDLAGFPIFDIEDYIFIAAEDREPPYVVSVDAWREKVVVTFSKEVRDQVRLYWLDGGSRRSAQEGVKDPFTRNTITFEFLEGQYLPANSIDLVIEFIADMNGNSAADYRTTVIPKFDIERPVVVSVASPSANEIIIEFSKTVRLGPANNNRFTLKNKNNVNITVDVSPYIPSGASIPDQRYIKLTGAIPSGDYTLTVSNVEDTTAQANRSIEAIYQVTVADKEPPKVVGVTADKNDSKVVLTFNKQLDWGSATDTRNYEYTLPGRGPVAIPPGSTAYLEKDQMTVILTFPSGGWEINAGQIVPNAFSLYVATDGADELRVLNIMDTNGNAMAPTLINVPGTNEVAAKLLPAAYAVTSQRIVMQFEGSGALPINAASHDFIIRSGGQNLSFRTMGYGSINATAREIYFDFDSITLNSDGTYGASRSPVTVEMVSPGLVSVTKTALGTPLEIQNNAVVQTVDNIKPGLQEAFRGYRAGGASQSLSNVVYPNITYNQVLIVFNETVQFQNVSGAAQLANLIDVKLESQPNVSLSPSAYTVEAYDDQLNITSTTNPVGSRMIVVTLISPTTEAMNVSVRANSLWDGNRDMIGANILNNTFETGFLVARD